MLFNKSTDKERRALELLQLTQRIGVVPGPDHMLVSAKVVTAPDFTSFLSSRETARLVALLHEYLPVVKAK